VKTRADRPPLVSIAVISAAALAYEILLMRLLSIIQWHHFAYMIISVALLGYGVSGAFLALAQDRLEGRFRGAYVINAALFGMTALGGFLAAQSLPFNALEFLWDPVQPLWLLLIYLLLFLPFFCAANCVCLSLTRFGARVHLIYAVDLIGAGAGALGVVAMLYLASPMTTLQAVSALGFVAAGVACIELRHSRWRFGLGFLAATLLVLSPTTAPRLVSSQFKSLSQALEVIGAEVIDERSSPLGMLTVVRSERVPFRHAPGLSLNAPAGPPAQLALYIDGEGMQAITRFEGNLDAITYLAYLTTALPYQLYDNPEVLVLGAGTGADVLQALYYDAHHTDAVELNPQIVEIVEDKLGDYSGRPYSRDGVHLHIGDVRGFVSSTEHKYDLVQVSLLDTFSASSAGLQALGENYLYTVESFENMLEILQPGGVIAITLWNNLPPRDGLKVVATAVAALEASGKARPAEHLVSIRGWATNTTLIAKQPFSTGELRQLRAFSDERSFDLVHYPGMTPSEANRYNLLQQPWYYDGVKSILGPQREAFFKAYKFYVRPATDDGPYFFQHLKWSSIPEFLRLRGQGGLPLLEQGYLVLILTFAQAILVSVVLIILPLGRRKPGGFREVRKAGTLSYFFLVGTAFMLIEIAFIQKFILFLHHPIFAVSAVLGSFLVFAGIGSALSARWPDKRSITTPVIAIIAISLIYFLTLPWIFDSLLHVHLAVRILMTAMLTAPLAMLMGMPFPLGLRRLAEGSRELIPWAWGINGCASVISAIGATLLAVHAGFAVVLVLALVLYLLAACVFPERDSFH